MIREPTENQLLTREELCERLRLSKRTISRMVSSGKLPRHIRLGGSVRWRQKDIADWIAAGCPEQDNGSK